MMKCAKCFLERHGGFEIEGDRRGILSDDLISQATAYRNIKMGLSRIGAKDNTNLTFSRAQTFFWHRCNGRPLRAWPALQCR
jgi:hypothetical protein